MAKESLRTVSLSPLHVRGGHSRGLGSANATVKRAFHKADNTLFAADVAHAQLGHVVREELAGLLKDRNGALLNILVR